MTSTAVAARPTQDLVSSSLTAEQISLVKRQLMSSKREPTDDELALFVYQCDRTGLDPFSRQIYAIYRWDSRLRDERMTVQAAIDGLRLVADRTDQYAPGDTYWCDSNGVWRDVWLDEAHPPKAAKVMVRKMIGNAIIEFGVPALWREYAPYKDGKLTGLWGKMPALMLAKCSEALGLRRAFPNETSGLYTAEEMAQADVERDETTVANFRDSFDATEQPPQQAKPKPAPRPVETDPDITNRAAAPQQAPQQAPPPEQAPEVNANDPVTPNEVEAMARFLDAVGAPESFWRMGLMMLGLEGLDQLTKGQAHALMEDAEARFKKVA